MSTSIFRKDKNQPKKSFVRSMLPPEMLLETYESRPQTAEFDRIDLVVDLRPGKDEIGAIVKSFIDAIAKHDEIVKMMEEQLVEINALKRVYNKKKRLFQNLDTAWNAMIQDKPNDFQEYNALLPKMKNIEERLRTIVDVEAKAALVVDYRRFKQLQPVCSNLAVIYDAFALARDEKDNALKAYVAATKIMNSYREKEKFIAAKISDDHVMADTMKKPLSAIFPNVHVGFILHKLNGERVDGLPYRTVLEVIRKAKTPHQAVFHRYDYRFNAIIGQWQSLQELRDVGVCLENPMIQRSDFVSVASSGDKATVKLLLSQGQDPNSADYSGATALLMAAANKHSDIITILQIAGGNVNSRDRNMMTPLLFAISRGHLDIVRQLLGLGAERNCSDKNKRDALYYAVLSGSETMLKFFMRPEKCNEQDVLWGFTPLHLASNQGNESSVRHLLSYGCSIYKKDNKGRTPEEVAQDSGHPHIAKLLRQVRLEAPAQLVFQDNFKDIQIWVGNEAAMNVNWSSDIDVNTVFYLHTEKALPKHTNWLKVDSNMKFEHHFLQLQRSSTRHAALKRGASAASWSSPSSTSSKLMKSLTNSKFYGDEEYGNDADEDDDDDDESREEEDKETKEKLDDDFKWAAMIEVIEKMVLSMITIFQNGGATILICDETGNDIAPTVYCAIAAIRLQHRVEDSLTLCQSLRPSVSVNKLFQRGLRQIQISIDKKFMLRMNNKLRYSAVVSTAF